MTADSFNSYYCSLSNIFTFSDNLYFELLF